eukprot:9501896-Pyramimonas_sp.AAC.1
MNVAFGRISAWACRRFTKRAAPPARPTPYWCGPAASESCVFRARASARRPRRRNVAPTKRGRTSPAPLASATSSPVRSAWSVSWGSSPNATRAAAQASSPEVS